MFASRRQTVAERLLMQKEFEMKLLEKAYIDSLELLEEAGKEEEHERHVREDLEKIDEWFDEIEELQEVDPKASEALLEEGPPLDVDQS